MSTIQRLVEKKLATPPKWLPSNVHYETIMGSMAYGVSSDASDYDIYGFCIPPKELVFPHLAGNIPGFGRQIAHFEQYQQHHMRDPSECSGKGRDYDVSIFSITKYFQLCMDCNPNMVDSLFTPANMTLHMTRIGNIVRDNRELFLSKLAWPKFKGYAYSQLHKMDIKTPQEGSKRDAIVKEFGYDLKFAYHVVRLLNEVEQILAEGTLDLQRSREQLKSIRRGEWTEQQIREYFADKEKQLEELYNKSELPAKPQEAKVKALLLQCLEEHYGDLSDAVVNPDADKMALQEIRAILDRYDTK